MASVADIKKRLQKNGITERTRDPYKTDSSKESGYVGSDAFQKIKERVKSSGVSFDINDDYINTFLSDANNFISTAKTDYEGIGWSNASSTYTARDEAWVDLSNRADYIGTWLKHNKDRLDPDTYNSLSNSLNSISSNMNPIMDGFRESRRFYSQWETEEDYNKAVEAQKEYDAMMSFDLEAAGEELRLLKNDRNAIAATEREIAKLESRNSTLRLAISKGGDAVAQGAYSKELEDNERKIAIWQGHIDAAYEKYGGAEGLKSLISQKEMPYNQAKRLQNGVALTENAMNADDFDAKSQYVSTKSGKWFAGLTTDYGLGYDDLAYEYINNVDGMRGEIKMKHLAYNHAPADDNESIYEKNGYDYMTPEEVKIYNYYYSTQGKEKAQEYLDTIQETLNQRKGSAMFEKIEDKPFLEYMFGVEAGLDQFKSGMENLFSNEDYIPLSATQIASGMVREDLGDVGFDLPEWMGGSSIGQVGYDMTTTTANMLPSILVSFIPTVGQVASPVLLGASAAGNAKAEMLRLGYTKEQATSYGLLVGASEGVLQYALGGISALGGKVSGNVISKMVSQIDNGLAKAAIKLGGNMVSEGLEESLQSILEPVFKSITTGEELEAVNWEEVIYSGLLGMLSAGAFEGTGAVANGVASGVDYLQQVKQHGQGIIDRGGVDSLKALAMDVAGANQNSLGQKVASGLGKVNHKASAMNVGKLSASIEKTMSSQDKADLTNALVKKGMSSKEAMLTARYLAGEVELSEAQVAKIKGNADVIAVVDELMNKADSAINERARSLMVARRGNITKAESVAPKATKSGDMDVKVEVNVDGKVSKSGKTTRKSTGEAVTINKDNAIAKVDDNGVVYFNTDQGEVAETDIEYASESEALVYEAFVDMSPGIANAVIKNYNGTVPAKTYIDGMREGILLYGMHNFVAVGKDISNASTFAELSDTDQDFALKLGRTMAKTEAEAKEASIRKTTDRAEESAPTKKTKGGRVSFEGGVKAKTKDQKKAVRLARYLSQAIGIDIVFYDARTTSNPYGKGSNGYYDKTTNSIHLDIQGAHNDTKTIAFTLSHEVVHFIKEWSPEKFNTFASFLMEQYAEHGVDTSTLLANKMAELKNTNADEVYEEMICDACETMLLDSNAMVKLMQLRQTDLTLFEKLKLHIIELLTALREAYRKLGYEATTDEAKALLKMTDVLDKLHTMFEEAAVEATQNFQADKTLTTEAVSVTEDGTVRLQMKQYQQTGRATLLNYLREQYGSEDANDLITTIDNIYDTLVEFKNNEALSVFSNWQDTEVELDENGHPIFTTSIKNGDYELNQDFSRVCKKRRQLDFVLNMLAEDPAFEASHLTKGDFVKINNAIKSHGFEIACALCFVDSKRFRQAEWADSFANTWNDILNAVVKDGSKLTPFNFATKNPNISDDGIEIDTGKAVTYRKWSDGKEDVKNRQTYESFEQMLSKGDDGKWLEGNANVRTIATLIRDNPELRHTFRGADIIASHGFDTIQRLAPGIRGILDGWGGSSVPKPSSNDTIYDNSILNISGYKKDTAYAMGGVRMNSFSDFMAHMFFDYCQAFADLSAKELPSQAYTKELTYVRFFGRSGQKINMSGIAAIRDDALPTTAQKGVTKAEAEANEQIEKMIAGLDVSRLLEHLGKDIYQLTEEDVEQFLDMCDYVWADESINMKHATLLQTGILYDRLSESKVEECYELLKAGEIEQALAVAGKENVDTEYAKHCGTIVVGVSDAHIRKLLRDPTVRMVIPYHKSGLNPVIARELRISAYNDYTLTQTTGVMRKGSKKADKIGSKAIKDSFGLVDFAFYDWFGKTIDGKLYDGKATADKYLEWCENGYYDEKVGDYVYYTTKGDGYILAKDFHRKAQIIPKFDAFMGEENYYKVLEDFDCYNTITGEHSAQGAVDFLRMGLPSDYKQVLKTALEDEQQVSDDFRDHLDNKGLKEEVMAIVKARGYEPSDMATTMGNIVDAVGAENVAEATELYTDVENTTRIKKQQKKTSDNTYEAIGKELLYYEEGDLAPDLTLVETVNDRTGSKEVTVKHYGQKPRDYIPKKIAYCYKLFEQHPDGTLHALFAGATKSVPLNEWRYAQGFPRTDAGVKGMNLRERYGWHLSAGLPSAPHLMSSKDFNRGYPSKGAYGHPKGSKRVWVRMAYDASTDFNSIADSTGKQNDIYGLIPFGGYYAFKENNQSEWVISSAVKIDKILTEEERQQILKEAGYDEHEAWRLKYQPTPEERAARELANKERAKAKARAKKLGIDSELSESTKAMRDAIKSRIIDNPELTDGIKKQVKKNPSTYAPTFYSAMSRVVDDIKMDKIGASSLVPYLKGKGIKHDEIKWSGIEAFLEGKKSVTKAELQEFLAGSSLEIVEQMSGYNQEVYDELDALWRQHAGVSLSETFSDDFDLPLTADNMADVFDDMERDGYDVPTYEVQHQMLTLARKAGNEGRWSKYKLAGGNNYRELVFVMPNSSYSNQAMRVHWGQDAEGVLAHARIQDMTTSDGKKMLFVEEIQSDWHNEGHKSGYADDEMFAQRDALERKVQEAFLKLEDYSVAATGMAGEWEAIERTPRGVKLLREYREAKAKLEKADDVYLRAVNDAPFRDTYHEYVLKRLLRMAAEEGYDSLGWTTADIQTKRWSDEYAEGYRIEYDQDIPKFLRKYGKKWGATVGKTTLQGVETKEIYYDVNRMDSYGSREAWENEVLSNLVAQGMPRNDVRSVKFREEDEYLIAYGKDGTEYDRAEIRRSGDSVWSMDITEAMEQSVLYEGQPKFQKKKLSNRTVLANALETTIDTSTQEGKNARKWLKEYKSKIDLIEKEEARLAELKSEIYAISFTKGADRSKLPSLNEEKQKTANRINTYDKQLTKLEAMKPIKDVLERERERVRKRTAEKGREAMKEAVKQTRESRDKAEATKKLQKLVLETARWLKNPTKTEVKCPDLLKPAYAEFLDGIDLSSHRLLKGGDPTQNDLKIASAMDSLATAIERIKNAQDPNVATDAVLDSGYLDLPDDFVRKLREMAEGIKKLMVGTDGAINRMSSSEIKQITKLIRTLNHAIKEMSKLYANLRFANVEELGDNTMTFTDDMGEAKNTNAVSDFVGWDNAMPYYAFKRFGVGGESIFEGLADGQDKLAHLAQAIFDFKDKTWTDKEAKAWGEDTHTIELPSGGSLTMTSADAMGIYCLSRRAQGLQHLLGGGTRVIGLKKGMKKASDSRSTLTQEDVNTIVDSLSKRQVEVANAIQGFMSTVCSGWGNEISMKRFLTEEFNEEFYYPIESNDENLETQDPKAQQSDLFRLLNISATKALTPGANNEVIIRNIFEVFTNHASDMARLNAFGMPLLDYMKWLNYREKTVNDDGQITVRGVRKSMKRTYGDKAINYVINLIKDVNGRHNDNGDNSFLMGMMRASKTASVGNNLRVAFLQFTSYPRASMVLSAGSLAKGVAKVPQIEKAKKYCGIALWKSFGFYDTNIARSIEDQIKGATNVRQKIIELSMKTPEWADAITWGALWNACEYEVAKTTKNKVGSEEFYREVGAKLREVVYATQVVDSVLTRSQIMRSKSGLTQLATAYMSEPTLTHNILMDAGFQFHREKRVTGSAKVAWKKTGKIVIGAVANYCVLQLLTSLAESLADAWRDDDDDEFYEKFLKAFGGNFVTNIIPFNKIPIISDIADLILSRFGIGFVSSDNLATSWITQTADALDVWAEVLGEKFGGEETSKTVYNAIYKTAKALSSMTGVSVSGAMREVVTLWNNTAGVYDTTLKIKSYEPTNEELGQELYEAILEGNDRQANSIEAQFDSQNAIDSAIRKALRENDPRIKEAAVAWHEGNVAEYSRIFDEMEAEGNFTTDIIKSAIESERNELKGDTESKDKEDKVESRYETEHYYTAIAKGDTITANKVLKDLIDTEVANGKSREDAEESIATGFRSNCREAYLNGEIDRSKAMDMLVQYGGKDTNDAYWELKKWDYIVANGSDDGYSKYNSFHEAVRTGKNLRAVISEYTTYGVTASTLSGQITSYFKPLYINMTNSERASIKGYLLNAYELLGYNRNEKNKDINKWLE